MTTTTEAILVRLDDGDEDGAVYAAARLGEKWNGLESPFFYRDVAQQFFADLDRESVENRGEFRYLYDTITDSFVVYLAEADGHPTSDVHEQYRPVETVWGTLYGPFEGYTFGIVEPTTVPLAESVRLVVEDRRRNYTDMGVAEAVDHARSVIGENDLDPVGADALSDAYRAVLAADPKSLIEAEAVVAGTAG